LAFPPTTDQGIFSLGEVGRRFARFLSYERESRCRLLLACVLQFRFRLADTGKFRLPWIRTALEAATLRESRNAISDYLEERKLTTDSGSPDDGPEGCLVGSFDLGQRPVHRFDAENVGWWNGDSLPVPSATEITAEF